MKNKALFNYFANGFKLANNNLELYAIGLVVLNYKLILVTIGINLSGFFLLLNILLSYVSIAFSLTIPLFLLLKLEGKKIGFRNGVEIVFENLKRLIIPLLILGLIGFIGLFIYSLSYVSLHNIINPSTNDFTGAIESLNPKGVSRYIWILISCFLIFQPYYFSLEHKGFYSSITRSIGLALKNLRYILLISVLVLLSYVFDLIIPDNVWGQFAWTIIAYYISYIIFSSTLFYFTENKNNNKLPAKDK